jgi:predicted RNA-binding Zn-ribbon protein involved in translation (DUF1610 family)
MKTGGPGGEPNTLGEGSACHSTYALVRSSKKADRLFKRKESCPDCGERAVEREQDLMWFCARCGANGPILSGVAVDLGLRGEPRGGEYERYRPRVPVTDQLVTVLPLLAELAAEPDLSERLNDAYFRWYYALTGTSFDIDDSDIKAAEATWVRNQLAEPELRADDARFYTLTACTSAGWQWRRAEQPENAPSAPSAALHWLERYRARGDAPGRSETIGLVADAMEDNAALERHSPGGEAYGHAFLTAGWLLFRESILTHRPQLARLHSEDLLQRSFRFGIALRDAQVAYDGESAAA